METSSNSNVTAMNQSNARDDGSTAQRLNGSTVRTNDRNDGSTAEPLNGSTNNQAAEAKQ